MDGDRYDNTGKAIVYKTGANAGDHIQAFISHLDNVLHFSTNQDVASNELVVGDAIQIAGWDGSKYSKYTFVITAVNADGTFTLDKDCTVAGGLHGSVYKVQETIGSPSGTWESWWEWWKRPKTKVTFTWNALTKAYAIGGLVYANVLTATRESTAALPHAQMIAAVTEVHDHC